MLFESRRNITKPAATFPDIFVEIEVIQLKIITPDKSSCDAEVPTVVHIYFTVQIFSY